MRFLGFIFGKSKNIERNLPPLFFTNTLSGEKERFEPVRPGEVKMYNCGPTLYDHPHIGNFRSFLFADFLRRAFEVNGYKVRQVMNLTDVGHLTGENEGNPDEGEDKVERRARHEGLSVEEIVAATSESFFNDLDRLNVRREKMQFPRASAHIGEQIALVQSLEEKGYTYRTSDGIYFDTSKFEDYGKLGKIDIKGQKAGARIAENREKRHPSDFALWKLSRPGENRLQEWPSPWGVGFPGWHLECSAMAMSLLAKTIDVHTGGIDHIPVHHNNEIAQSEAATNKPFARYWLHNAFISIDGQKIAKSLGNAITVQNLVDRGFSPLAYRYLLLSAHYRAPMNFTWESLEASQTALKRLHRFFFEELGQRNGTVSASYKAKFLEHVNDDLDLPGALATLWELVKDESVSKSDKRTTLLWMDQVFGIGLQKGDKEIRKGLNIATEQENSQVPSDVQALVAERETARKEGRFEEADRLRDEIASKGYVVSDTDAGPKIRNL